MSSFTGFMGIVVGSNSLCGYRNVVKNKDVPGINGPPDEGSGMERSALTRQ